jgi:hypothetical protein
MYMVLDHYKRIKDDAAKIIDTVLRTPIGPQIAEQAIAAFDKLYRIVFFIQYI